MEVLRDDCMLLTGDDNGTVKLWDLRKRSCAFEWTESEDFISDFAIPQTGNMGLYVRYGNKNQQGKDGSVEMVIWLLSI